MKKFLIISGIVFWILILFGSILFGIFACRGFSLDASSKAYIDKNIPIIISTWSEQELFKCGSSGFKAAVSNPDKQTSFDQTWTSFSKLGVLKKYSGSDGQSYQGFSFLKGKKEEDGFKVTAEYVVNADFQNGSAKITVDLVHENGDWKINYFSLGSN